MTVEFQARNEISFYQAVETAIAAKRRGYFKSDVGWFLEWLARLNLGDVAAGQAILQRGPSYCSASIADRFDVFSEVLSRVLPAKDGSFAWISCQVPLLATNCYAVAATAFRDSRGLDEANRLYAQIQQTLAQR